MLHILHPPLLIILVFAAVGSVKGKSVVMESRANFSCCQSSKIEFDPRYDTTWSIKDKTIAYLNKHSNACIAPCKNIEVGQMLLDQCVRINATMVFTDETNVTAEKRISFFGQPCSGSPGSQGSVGLLLLAVVITGLIEK
ncbi:uncharacterized protein LOC144464458 [Epinephelus lanceolatus]